MKVLIVEDDFTSRRYVARFMKQYSDVDIAVDGAEAVDIFINAVKKREYYHLVLLDIMMPNMNGIDTLKAIRAIEEEKQLEKKDFCKVIMMSSLNEKNDVQLALNLGCNGYANKPVRLDKLMEVMKKLRLPLNIKKEELVTATNEIIS